MLADLARTAKEFEKQLQRLSKLTGNKAETVIKKTVIDLAEAIKKGTPYDTWLAKSGWIVEVNGYSEDAAVEISKTDNINEFNYSLGDMLYIYNNVEYIQVLEDGHSDQAKQGFVSVSLNQFGEQLKEQISKVDELQ